PFPEMRWPHQIWFAYVRMLIWRSWTALFRLINQVDRICMRKNAEKSRKKPMSKNLFFRIFMRRPIGRMSWLKPADFSQDQSSKAKIFKPCRWVRDCQQMWRKEANQAIERDFKKKVAWKGN